MRGRQIERVFVYNEVRMELATEEGIAELSSTNNRSGTEKAWDKHLVKNLAQQLPQKKCSPTPEVDTETRHSVNPSKGLIRFPSSKFRIFLR